MNYSDFLKQKTIVDQPTGIKTPLRLSGKLFEYQHDITSWGLKRGRAACFADCGLGKSPIQLEWANQVVKETGGNVLILAPLAVAQQTVREAAKFKIKAAYCRHEVDRKPGITITNYECLHQFDVSKFAGVVLDESSILKSYTGKFRNYVIESFAQTPFRLACTATPAPNDYMELGNHAEFLGVMTRTEMLCTFFYHDGGDTAQWVLKGHAEDAFWRWVASWAVMIRKPSDLGYSDKGFNLPPLQIHQHIIAQDNPSEGFLFAMPAATLSEQRIVKKESIDQRCEMAAALVRKATGPCVVWCELNKEGDALEEKIGRSLQMTGSDTPDQKEEALLSFSSGKKRVLVTKPSIAGFGLNWQHCANMVFVNLSHSYEQFYQAVRRCWRFGQKKPVNVHLVLMDSEVLILENIQRKQREADAMAENMVRHMRDSMQQNIKGQVRDTIDYAPKVAMALPKWIK